MSQKLKTDRVGEVCISKEGYKLRIKEYTNALNMIVEIVGEDYTYETKATYQEFKKRQICNPYHRSVYGVGYIGVGDYKVSNNRKHNRSYLIWKGMLKRCYDTFSNKNNASYIECTVCDEWHNYQNFAKWYEENYYEIDGEIVSLDKDILVKGNKVYSPETCVFAPQKINTIFIKQKTGDLPQGVKKENGRYYVRVVDEHGKRKQVGGFSNIEDAKKCYVEIKQRIIKAYADVYKNIIPQKLYDAMVNYEV